MCLKRSKSEERHPSSQATCSLISGRSLHVLAVYVSVNRNEFGITTIDTHHEASEMLSAMCGDDDLAVRSTKRALETSSCCPPTFLYCRFRTNRRASLGFVIPLSPSLPSLSWTSSSSAVRRASRSSSSPRRLCANAESTVVGVLGPATSTRIIAIESPALLGGGRGSL